MRLKLLSHRTELVFVTLVIVGLGIITRTWVLSAKELKYCQANLKQLGFALLQYTKDYDEVFPPVAKWADVLPPYTQMKSGRWFHCPSAANGYAMNRNLDGPSGSKLSSLRLPAAMPAFFESNLGHKNAHDTGDSWPLPPRHRGGNNVTFADGHVKWLRQRPMFQPIPGARPMPIAPSTQ